jgi:hypothetical protein
MFFNLLSSNISAVKDALVKGYDLGSITVDKSKTPGSDRLIMILLHNK